MNLWRAKRKDDAALLRYLHRLLHRGGFQITS